VFLKACLNGARLPGEHRALPVRAEELARDARLVQAAGVQAVHLHVKDDRGADTFDATLTDAAVRAVRAAAPGLPVGLTTGAWAAPDPADRVVAIGSWSQIPDFVSVNWHEDGAVGSIRTSAQMSDGRVRARERPQLTRAGSSPMGS
jgi:uncharacterized protein (DUF849 family)